MPVEAFLKDGTYKVSSQKEKRLYGANTGVTRDILIIKMFTSPKNCTVKIKIPGMAELLHTGVFH